MSLAPLHQINFFFRPLPLAAVAIMALNDHYLKYQYPGVITGKLSDFAGMFYFPIFVAALVILTAQICGWKSVVLNRRLAIGSIVFADLLLIGVKLSPAFSTFIEAIFEQYFFRIQLINDPTDLVAIAVNLPTVLYLKPYFSLQK